MRLPKVYIKFQSPVIIKVSGKFDFLKTIEREFEEERTLNALKIYKTYCGLGLKEAKEDFDSVSVPFNRHSKEGRKKIIKGLQRRIVERGIKVMTRDEYEAYMRQTRH